MLIDNHEINIYKNFTSNNVFIQLIDEHDYSLIESEINHVDNGDFCLITYKVNNWNEELTPWKMNPIFGKVGFGDGADDTLKIIIDKVLPIIDNYKNKNIYIVGYSLAGLFALYSGYNSNLFKGVIAASPSVWYKDWIDYIFNHHMKSPIVYLSLGDKEENTKNQTMKRVAANIKEQYNSLINDNIKCILEMNHGNHFVDSDIRVAKGINYILKENSK